MLRFWLDDRPLGGVGMGRQAHRPAEARKAGGRESGEFAALFEHLLRGIQNLEWFDEELVERFPSTSFWRSLPRSSWSCVTFFDATIWER
jgi:hypothetical protein